jgi:hypothetical protein
MKKLHPAGVTTCVRDPETTRHGMAVLIGAVLTTVGGKVFNFGNKKISEPTEKWEIPEIPEISAQIQIEFNFFKRI